MKRQITVRYSTHVPDDMSDEQILEWLQFTLTERGEIDEDNPMHGCGPEPDNDSISWEVRVS
jgi:hypothetical protein